MIDKLSIRTVIDREVVKSHGSCRIFKSPYYENAFNLTLKQGKKVQLYFSENQKPLRDKVVINPSHFASFHELKNILIPLLGENHEISRIDFFADYEDLSVEDLHRRILIPRKRVSTSFESHRMTGFYIGKHPNQIKVYDRRYARRNKTEAIRIEVSSSNQKCLIKDVAKIPDLKNFNPFSQVKFLKIQEDLANLSISDMGKLELLKTYRDRFGFHQAYKKLNKQRNFSRTFLKFLVPDDSVTPPNDVFQKKLELFLDDRERKND